MAASVRLSGVLGAVLVCLMAASPGPAGAATLSRSDRVLPQAQHGQAAIRSLGSNLDVAAARNDLTPRRLRSILSEDSTAWVAPEGKLFYIESAADQTIAADPGSVTPPPRYPTSQTFALHSRPGASRKVFLDFDGATVRDTAWNTGTNAIANGTHIGWDSDGSPSTFSTTEHGWIQEVWRQVAETYAPFDVDITTQDPGAAGWTRTSSSDTSYGTHVVITSSPTPKQQACGSCLGVAWVGTFDLVDSSALYQPAWVFADDPGFSPTVIAQAAAHETGHTLGLHHDGTSTSAYFAGTQAWGPIMGSSMSRAVSQFSIGEYAGADNFEDDFAVMQANGLPLRADDHGSSLVSADNLGAQPAYDVSGVISTRTDADLFAITLPCATDLSVSANGIGDQSALDLSLAVLDATGTQLTQSSPDSSWSGAPPTSNGMDAQVTVPVASGTYFLRVDGVGNGDPSGTGWSDYGSLGQYRLRSSGCPASTTPTTSTTPTDVTPTGTGVTDPSTAPPPAEKPATPTPTPSPTRPGAPITGTPSSGSVGGRSTAITRWKAPSITGGAALTKYRVRAQRRNSSNHVVAVTYSGNLGPSVRALAMRLPRGHYTFSIMVWNKVGSSPWSRISRLVTAR